MKKGFTLIELLVVTAIIGILSSVGAVSYGFVRSKARDAKRISDIQTIRSAVESFFEFYSSYPPAPASGIILGSPNAKSISAAGITAAGKEKPTVFLVNVPSNPVPNGIDYLYHSRNQDGTPCEFSGCAKYDVGFLLETDIGDYKAGPHRMTETNLEGPEGNIKDFNSVSFLQQITPKAEDIRVAREAAQKASATVQQVTARPEVQMVGNIAVPVSVVTALASLTTALASAAPLANAGQVFVFFFSQPLLLLGRRKRETWGTVYHSGKKIPVDLASVRLIDSKTNRPVGTKVTDVNGRYAFTPPAGTYRIEVSKPGFSFPAQSLIDVHDDGKFVDIYHGTLIKVETSGQSVTPNIPMDSIKEPSADPRELSNIEGRLALKRLIAKSGPAMSVFLLVIRPTFTTGLLCALQIAIYMAFKRMAEPKQPKNQGIVFDADSKDPIKGAVVRVLSLPYSKVLETKLSDAQGRYNFYVGPGKYQVTVQKPGYDKTETNEIDLSAIAIDKPTFIAADLPLRKTGVAPAEPQPAVPAATPATS